MLTSSWNSINDYNFYLSLVVFLFYVKFHFHTSATWAFRYSSQILWSVRAANRHCLCYYWTLKGPNHWRHVKFCYLIYWFVLLWCVTPVGNVFCQRR